MINSNIYAILRDTRPFFTPKLTPREAAVDVYYMGHPVAGDEHFTYEQNLAHIPHMIRVLADCGIHAQAPYYATLLAYPDPTKEQITKGLLEDCEIVRCMRKIVLVGHKLSIGMGQELDALDGSGTVLNLIGLSDQQIRRRFGLR